MTTISTLGYNVPLDNKQKSYGFVPGYWHFSIYTTWFYWVFIDLSSECILKCSHSIILGFRIQDKIKWSKTFVFWEYFWPVQISYTYLHCGETLRPQAFLVARGHVVHINYLTGGVDLFEFLNPSWFTRFSLMTELEFLKPQVNIHMIW